MSIADGPLFIKTADLPEDCQTSPDMKGRAKYFARVMYSGQMYYLPVVPHTAKMLGLVTTRPPTHKELPYEREIALEDFFRDMVAAVYIQARDTVGHEIKGTLSDEIKEQFERVFAEGLIKIVDTRLQRGLPTPEEHDRLETYEKP